MKLVLTAAVWFALSASAIAQSAMPGQTIIAPAMMHQAPVPHVAVLSHMPRQGVIPQTAFPRDRAGYTPMQHYYVPVPISHEPQPQL